MRLQGNVPESQNLLHTLAMRCQCLQKRLIAKEDNVQYEKGQHNINLRSFTGLYPEGTITIIQIWFPAKQPQKLQLLIPSVIPQFWWSLSISLKKTANPNLKTLNDGKCSTTLSKLLHSLITFYCWRSLPHFDSEFIKLLIPATGSHSPFICKIKEPSTTRKLSSCGQLRTTNNSPLNLLFV